jgi:2-C-methyl-D-erythritol 4-phosphate cytidylyltransferase
LGRPVIGYTLDVLDASPEIDDVIIVVPADWLEAARKVMDGLPGVKVREIVPGSDTRQASSRAGLERVSRWGSVDRVLIHDAVRPFLTTDLVRETLRQLGETGAVTCGSPCTDTLLRVDEGRVVEVPDRSGLYHCRTPQAFRLDLALRAHRQALADGITDASDDVQLVLRLGVGAVVIPSGLENLKITVSQDLDTAAALMRGHQD